MERSYKTIFVCSKKITYTERSRDMKKKCSLKKKDSVKSETMSLTIKMYVSLPQLYLNSISDGGIIFLDK